MRAIDNYTDKEIDNTYQRIDANKAQHSPLPWSADKWATGYTVSATDHSVCHLQDCNNDEANARLIVRAVNHADKLAEALRDIADYGRSYGITDADAVEAIRNKARHALAAYDESQQ